MSSSVIKIWTGVGAFILAGAASITLGSPAVAMPTGNFVIAAEAGGEGGETAEGAAKAPVPAKAPAYPVQGGEGGEAAKPKFVNKLTNAQLKTALRKGGHVIYFRHAQTEKDYVDQTTAVMGKCDTQRMLSVMGWNQAKSIGNGFKALKIPVGKVYSSEYCRAWQTADLAFGQYKMMAALNFPKAGEYTDAQKAQMRANLTPLLLEAPTPGTNTVIVGHDDVFDAVTGIYPEPQGIAYIVKALPGGKLEVIAGIKAEEWLEMSKISVSR